MYGCVHHAIRHGATVEGLAAVPTLPDLTRKMSHAKTLPGFGEGEIGDAAFKLAHI